MFPRKISTSGRYFTDEKGHPFFWMGDTAWPLFTQYGNAEAEDYLRDRASKGFTVIQGVIAWFGGMNPHPTGLSPNFEGQFPWLNHDPAQPNPAFFRHVDTLLNMAQALGLTIAILPTWGNFVTDEHMLNLSNARRYGQWLGERYRDQPNIIWINGGDCLPYGFEAVFDALAEGLRAGDGGNHLITYHPCALHSSSQFFRDRTWLDFSMIQTWTDWHKTYDSVITDGLSSPVRPVVLGEGAYENGPEYARGPITPLITRRQHWWTFLAGGYYTYGQDQMWRVSPGWIETLNTPGAGQMRILQATVSALPWWERIPDQSLLDEGASGGETLNAAVRGSDGRWALIYLSSRCHVRLRMERLAAPHVKAEWINPATGQRSDAGTWQTYTPAGIRQVRNSHFQWFSTPDFWEDAALLLQATD